MIKRIIFLFVVVVFIGSLQQQVFALTAEQKRVFDSGVYYFDVEKGCATSPTVSLSGNTFGTDTSGGDTIIQKISPVPFSGASITPTGVVLHWTGGSPNQTVESFIDGISGRGFSVQIYIDGSGNVYQLVDQLNTLTAHAEGANSKTIGIEIAAGSDGTVETAAEELNANTMQKQAVVRTVKYLVDTFGMDIDPAVVNLKGILSHHQISPDRKSDVGDRYHSEIVNAVKNNGQLTVNSDGSCSPVSGGGGGGEPETNKLIGQQLAANSGFTGAEWACLLELWTRESSWNQEADNPGSSAYGIPQALVNLHKINIDNNYAGYYDTEVQVTPGVSSTYNYTGGDPPTQIRWGLDYIIGRYRTPCQALAFHDANNYY